MRAHRGESSKFSHPRSGFRCKTPLRVLAVCGVLTVIVMAMDPGFSAAQSTKPHHNHSVQKSVRHSVRRSAQNESNNADPMISIFTARSLDHTYAITAGPDGAMWFTNYGNNSIGRISITGVVNKYTSPSIDVPLDITAGRDGALWFTNSGNASIGRISTTGAVTNYTAPSISDPQGITAGPDGALWFTNVGNDSIGRISTSGVVSNYADPTINDPQNIAAGPDGALWFTNYCNSESSCTSSIGRITTAGVVTHFSIRGLPGSGPNDITAGPDGALWFTEERDPSIGIGRITTAGKITTYGAVSGQIAAGPDGALWFTGPSSIGRITTAGAITKYPSSNQPQDITAGPDGTLWFTGGNSIGRIATRLAIATASLPDGTVGLPYSSPLAALGGNPPYTWKLGSGSLPPGLKLDKSTGAISGTPKKSGTSTFTVEVLDTKIKVKGHPSTQNTATRVFTISIAGALVNSEWSGYVLAGYSIKSNGKPTSGSGVDYTAIQATVTVPTLRDSGCLHPGNDPCEWSSSWVGIGGFIKDAGNLIQAGISDSIKPDGTDFYCMFTELLPAGPVCHFGVKPGDRVSIAIFEVPLNECGASSPSPYGCWRIAITDGSESYDQTYIYTSSMESADVILERVNGEGFLADTTNVLFDSACYASSSPRRTPIWEPFTQASSGKMTELFIRDGGSVSFATPSPFTTADNSFQVAIGTAVPPAPAVNASATSC